MDPSLNQSGIVDSMPLKESKKNKGLVTGIVICLILAIGGVGFGIYGMFFSNSGGSSSTGEGGQETTQSDTSANQDLDTYVVRDLKHKTFRLLGFRNGLSEGDYYDDSGHFMVYSDYMPIKQLISNELDDTSKVYVTLETTSLDKDKYCNYPYADGVKADIDSVLSQSGNNIEIGVANIDCISYGVANDDFRGLWGGELPKLNAIPTNSNANGDFAYGANRDAYYYHVIGGRGGTSSSFAVGKISQIGESDGDAFIDASVGRLYVSAGNPTELYSDVEMNTKTRSFDQLISSWSELGLTDDDIASFQAYRFVFKKTTDGTYYFSNVEKL